MERTSLGPVNGLYPSLTTLVGADVAGRPNWLTVAHVGIMNHAAGEVPQYLSVSLNRGHHTNHGIREHGEFSINIPDQELLVQTDYAGLVSGAKVDKSELFTLERGILEHAPLIRECPLVMELKLAERLELGHHEVFIGELVNTLVDSDCLSGQKPDLARINPLLFDFMSISYWSLGKRTGNPWRDGKALKPAKSTTAGT